MGKSKKEKVELYTNKILEFLKQIENIYKPVEYLEIVNEFVKQNYPAIKFAAFQSKPPDFNLIDILKSKFSQQAYKKLMTVKKSKYNFENGFFCTDKLYIYPIGMTSNIVDYVFVFQGLENNNLDIIRQLSKGIQSTYRLAKSNYDYGTESSMNLNANLISQICHDFNSLISIVKMEQDIHNPELEGQLHYSVELTKDILFYVREMDLLTSKVKIIELVDSIIEKIEIPKKIEFVVNCEIEDIEMDIDVELFDRAIFEVIQNAITAITGKSGKIILSVQEKTTESIFGDKKWLVLKIEDDGAGIKNDFLPMVINPFFTTMKSNKHYGLGLSIAEKIIKEHSGFINIESEYRKNTIVSIFLSLSNKGV